MDCAFWKYHHGERDLGRDIDRLADELWTYDQVWGIET